jgi:hypothetical protein
VLRILPAGTLLGGYDAQKVALTISSEWKRDDLVVVLSNYGSVPISLAYYLPPQTPMLTLAYLPRKEEGPVSMPAKLDSMWPRLDQGVGSTSHLWVIRSFPDSVSSRKLDDWLDWHYRRVSLRRYGQMIISEMERLESTDTTASGDPGSHVAGRLP